MKTQPDGRGAGPDTPSAEALLHELQSHQIELEMQNEELRRSQLALEESRDRYLDLYEFAPVGYLTLSRSGLIAESNLAGASLLGVERPRLRRRRFEHFVAEADRERWNCLFELLIRHDARQSCELALQRGDGMVFYVRLDCLCYGSAGDEPAVRVALTDISDRMRLLMESTAEGIYAVNESGRCTIANPACARLLGYSSPRELLGREMHPLMHYRHADGSDFAAGTCPVERAVRTGQAIQRREDVFWRADGSALPVEMSASPLSQDGIVVGAVVSFNDITDRKQAKQALLDADRRKDEFLAMLAHELRNPLAPIRNAAHVIGLLGPEEPKIQWAQETIERQVAHLTRMVDDLLDVSRIALGKITLKFEAVELAAVAEKVLDVARPLAEGKSQRLTARLPERPLWLEGDPVRLSQVLLNLLDNAIKYTPDGGSIEIGARAVGEQVEIAVRDDGMGIAAELLPRVFDLFQQDDRALDRAKGGLGIGLTLVQRLVAAHGGQVAAHSDGPGRGSTFTVRLPARPAPPPSAAAAPDPRKPHPAMPVLVVDDEHDVAHSMAMLLDLEGYDVRIARSGPEALELVPDFQPAAILLDIGLKGMDGFETARRLRTLPAGQGAYLVALTGYGDAETKAQALAAGCDHFMVKPVDCGVLCELLAGKSRKRGEASA